jgi:hypothetical protein
VGLLAFRSICKAKRSSSQTRSRLAGQEIPTQTNEHIKLVPRYADNMQSKVDHLMMSCSADSFRLNGLFQPRQANIHTHLLHSILRVSLIEIRRGVGTNFITRRVCCRLFCVLNTHQLKPNIPSFTLCKCTERQMQSNNGSYV